MGKMILHRGKLKTISEAAEEENVSYMTMYMRHKAMEEGKPKRNTSKRSVEWRDKEGKLHHFESISKLAEFLGVSREWARQLIDRQDREG